MAQFNWDVIKTYLTFKIDKNASIVGLKLKKGKHNLIRLTLFDNTQSEIGKGSLEVMILHKGVEICKIDALHSLKADTQYRLCLTFNCSESCVHEVYQLPKLENECIYNGLTLNTFAMQEIDSSI